MNYVVVEKKSERRRRASERARARVSERERDDLIATAGNEEEGDEGGERVRPTTTRGSEGVALSSPYLFVSFPYTYV